MQEKQQDQDSRSVHKGESPATYDFFCLQRIKKRTAFVGMAAWWCCDGDAGSPVVEAVPECLFVDFF